jgi:hypothetical protein
MKKIFLFICVITLLTTGCFFPGRGGGGGHWHDRGEIDHGPRIVETRAPEIVVAAPVVNVQGPEIVVAAP